MRQRCTKEGKRSHRFRSMVVPVRVRGVVVEFMSYTGRLRVVLTFTAPKLHHLPTRPKRKKCRNLSFLTSAITFFRGAAATASTADTATSCRLGRRTLPTRAAHCRLRRPWRRSIWVRWASHCHQWSAHCHCLHCRPDRRQRQHGCSRCRRQPRCRLSSMRGRRVCSLPKETAAMATNAGSAMFLWRRRRRMSAVNRPRANRHRRHHQGRRFCSRLLCRRRQLRPLPLRQLTLARCAPFSPRATAATGPAAASGTPSGRQVLCAPRRRRP